MPETDSSSKASAADGDVLELGHLGLDVSQKFVGEFDDLCTLREGAKKDQVS